MDTTVQVDINGLTFNVDPDPDGIDWTVGDVEGWDSPDEDLAAAGMSSSDGDAVGRHRLRGRRMVAVGTVVAPPEHHWSAYYRLLGLTNNMHTPRDLVMHEVAAPGGSKVVRYIRGGKPDVQLVNGRVFQFRLPLLCPDGRKYGLDPVEIVIPAGGSALVTGLGNYPGGTPVTVVGSGDVDVSSSVTGERLSTRTPVPAGTVLDGATRTVTTAGGVDLFTALAVSFSWLHVVEGDQTITNHGDSAVTLTYTDAWL